MPKCIYNDATEKKKNNLDMSTLLLPFEINVIFEGNEISSEKRILSFDRID